MRRAAVVVRYLGAAGLRRRVPLDALHAAAPDPVESSRAGREPRAARTPEVARMSVSHLARLAALALFATLAGCGATRLDYTPQAVGSVADARALLERAAHEQPSPHAPSRFELGDDYFEMARGVRSGGTGVGLGVGIGHGIGVGVGGSRSRTTVVVDRVYFDAITDLQVYEDGDHFFVRVRYSAGNGKVSLYTASEARAHELADALQRLRP